ncbi:ABC transporter ATP-binding protein [Roseovarius sp. D22-M7]|uniref:ABC transporter ATP-binding protein n=1 Tax=Roseovarius sp. D22-M7 TaxID=3127116 RepID=UPI00300FA4AA
MANRDRALSAVLVVGCGILQAVALAVAAFATRDAFAALHGGEALNLQTVWELALAGAIAAVCLYVSRRQAEGLGQSYAIALRHELYAKIASLPKSRHEERRVGALALRFVGDLSAARLWFGRGLPDVLTALVVLPGAVAILVSLDQRIALAGLAPLGFAMVLMAILAWRLERRHQRLRKRRANIAIAMIERIAIAPELDRMGRTAKELRALDDQGDALKANAVARVGRTTGLQAILQAGVALSGLAILWFASLGSTTPATVAASLSVLALVALPLQDLGAAWDRYCAWAVAREKAMRLLNEPEIPRLTKPYKHPASVTVRGEIAGEPVHFTAEAGTLTKLESPASAKIARLIAGLDQDAGVRVSFDEGSETPHVAYIGDTHIGLQGSLRRSATLSAPKRPKDARVCDVLRAFGLSDMLAAHRGLDQRLSENGKGLSAAQTLRLDLARAVLGQAEIVVISSLRWNVDPERDGLLATLQELSPTTVIVDEGENHSIMSENLKAD